MDTDSAKKTAMPAKKTTKKTAKKTAKKAAKKVAKKVAKKPVKKTAKKAAAKKAAKKPVKKMAKKPVKKTAKKAAAKKVAKKVTNKPVKKAAMKTVKKVAKKVTKKVTKKAAKKVVKKTAKKAAKKTTKKATAAALRKAAAAGNTRSVAAVAALAEPDAAGYVVINGRRVRMISTKGRHHDQEEDLEFEEGGRSRGSDCSRRQVEDQAGGRRTSTNIRSCFSRSEPSCWVFSTASRTRRCDPTVATSRTCHCTWPTSGPTPSIRTWPWAWRRPNESCSRRSLLLCRGSRTRPTVFA